MKNYRLKYINTFLGRADEKEMENCELYIDKGVFLFERPSKNPDVETRFLILAIPMQLVIAVEEIEKVSPILGS